jgi:carbonic anhydrase/acetyltransferase-like protein (isoleucine patch superfamily)
MSIAIVDRGERNRLEIPADILAGGEGEIVFEGDDNELILETGSQMWGGRIVLGTRCRFHAGPECKLGAVDAYARERATIEIGARTMFTFKTMLFAHEPGTIRIGADCLIASGTLFTVSDMHKILDARSGRRLNGARDVLVEDNVWVGLDAALLKGATVGHGSVVGMRAVVTGTVKPGCVVAGAPARVVRRGVRWEP